ncbi:MAG: hypothetical protein ABI882_21825, partial [Acidobacteriota bacterium]
RRGVRLRQAGRDKPRPYGLRVSLRSSPTGTRSGQTAQSPGKIIVFTQISDPEGTDICTSEAAASPRPSRLLSPPPARRLRGNGEGLRV